MSERTEFERDPRGYLCHWSEMAGEDARHEMIRHLVGWMSKDEAREFADANGYAPERDEDEEPEEDEDE